MNRSGATAILRAGLVRQRQGIARRAAATREGEDVSHKWKFVRSGGFDQVRLETAADLLALDQLDQKLWVALACPTTGLEFDAQTLALVDTDKDGRIRAPELIAAVKWAASLLKNPEDLVKGSAELPLAAINDAAPDGKAIVASAKLILASLGKPTAASISADDTQAAGKALAQMPLNGDGVVPPESAGDPAVRAFVVDILACVGGETDSSGKPGVTQAKSDEFHKEAQAFADWQAMGEADSKKVLPLGAATAAADALVRELKPKMEDFFLRARLAAFDPRAVEAFSRQEEKDYLALAAKDLTAAAQEFAGFPLALVKPGGALPLTEGTNPVWAAALTRLRAEVVAPLLGDRAALTEQGWAAVVAALAPYAAWQASKPATRVEKLGVARLRELLAGGLRESLAALIAQDKTVEAEVKAIVAVDRLVRYHRDLFRLCNNFVCFRDFYTRRDRAIFQAGTLYLDQRSCELCLTVEDAGKHAAMAGKAGAYLAYCDCARRGMGEKMQIVAAFTDGDSDNLMVGRNGVFYDRKGRDWDATIAKIVENPIGLRQAWVSPYKKFVRMIEEQVAKRAVAAEAASQEKLAAVATAVANVDKGSVGASAAPVAPKKVDVGTVAAMGVAFGAIGTALSALATGILRLPVWQIPLVFAGLALLISAPSVLIAWLKLRMRNLGPILDANGWAVNARARVNVAFGATLTGVATLPKRAERSLADPFADKRSAWPAVVVALVILGVVLHFLDKAHWFLK